jgi:hypothetical protein
MPSGDAMDQQPNQPSPLQLAYERLSVQANLQAAFLGQASHELRAPINQIISLHQLILEGLCESPEEEQEFLAQANQAIYKVLENLDLLINLSKLDIGALTPQPGSTELSPVLAEVQQLSAMKCINRHCRLDVDPTESDLVVMTDPKWLRQALMLWIEGALATGSTQIKLGVEASNPASVAVCLSCDCPLTPWQGDKGEDLVTPSGISPGSAPPPLTELSPHFCHQLVQRIAHHLNHEYKLVEDAKGTTQYRIVLPLNV